VATLVSLAVIILRFRSGLKKQGYNAQEILLWSTRWTVPYAWFSLCFLILITLTLGWTVFVKQEAECRGFPSNLCRD
jgi:amino acid permease